MYAPFHIEFRGLAQSAPISIAPKTKLCVLLGSSANLNFLQETNKKYSPLKTKP